MRSEDIRNITIAGHSGTGKTTIIDALAYTAKATTRFGHVNDGSSISDYQPDEIEKKISVNSTLVSFEFNGKKFNFIDTPGFQDFIGEVCGSLRACDILMNVIGEDSGVQFATRRYIKEADRLGLAKLFFINKIDKEGTNFEGVVDQIRSAVKTGVVPLTMPIGAGPTFKGLINLITMKAYEYPDVNTVKETAIPADLKTAAEEARGRMIEGVAEGDDKLTEKFIDQGTLSEEEIQKGLVEGLLNGKLSAVICGAAEKNIGMNLLLEIIGAYLPSPVLKGEVVLKNGSSDVRIKIAPESPLTGLVFKTATEPHVGDLNYVRVFTGTIHAGMDVMNATKNHVERISQLMTFTGKEKKDMKEAIAGDICVLVKLKDSIVGNTFCDVKSKIEFPPIEFPKPVIEIAIVPKEKVDEDHMGNALHKMLAQDPTLKMRVVPELHQTIISGMGEQQIEILKKQLHRKFNVNIELQRPKVAYRETIKKINKGQGKYKKQSGGHGQYGDCWIELQPLPLNYEKDFEFEDKIFGGSIPAKYVPSVEKGLIESVNRGFLSGHKVIKIKAIVYDGSYHDVDSSDIAFQVAASMAFKNVMEGANPVLLEPINKVKIFVSDNYLGDVMGDLNSKRGKILGMDDEDGLKVVKAMVPDAEMYKYSNSLRSLTQGTGSFEMAFDHYEEVPHDQSQKIIDQYQKEKAAMEQAK
jgi:elongation factor G